jgi:hypothetical protein|tara:strand:+ start:1589 stop:1882 length:294 start_codon:yes stop_codon:yes gene_type:complete
VAPLFRKNLFKQIHEIIFHGNGGYDYFTVYNMPLWLRKYTFSEIQKYYSEKQEAENKAAQGQNSTSANIGDPIPAHMKKALQQTKPSSSYTTQKSKK